jgi:hypothetical protein
MTQSQAAGFALVGQAFVPCPWLLLWARRGGKIFHMSFVISHLPFALLLSAFNEK